MTTEEKVDAIISHFGLDAHWARAEARAAADLEEAKARGEVAARSNDPVKIAAATAELKKLLEKA